MPETILVEVECIKSTAADIDYFEKDQFYTIDMAWAKARGIWRYFRPLNELSVREAEERVRDEIVPQRDAIAEENRKQNEEGDRKLDEKKPDPVQSFPGIDNSADEVQSHSTPGTQGSPAQQIASKTPAGVESHSRPGKRRGKK